jgi:hypothetical protein
MGSRLPTKGPKWCERRERRKRGKLRCATNLDHPDESVRDGEKTGKKVKAAMCNKVTFPIELFEKATQRQRGKVAMCNKTFLSASYHVQNQTAELG